jgi:hypothetical protein
MAELVRWLNDNAIVVAGVLWTKGKARKAATCHISGKKIAVGDDVFRPQTNTGMRVYRILATEVRRP